MAIKNIITLGIGCSPGNIKYFLLLGLNTGVVYLAICRMYAVALEDRAFIVGSEDRAFIVPCQEA